METEEVDTAQVWERAREQYKTETGHELPDHIVENYELLLSRTPGPEEIDKAFERGKRAAELHQPGPPPVAAVLFVASIAAVVGGVAGVALTSSFGPAVVSAVSAAFGFCLAVVFLIAAE